MTTISTLREMIELPITWILSIIALLGATVTTLAGIIYKSLGDRLAAQDSIIAHLRADVDRLVKGCGHRECLWRN